MTTDPMEAARAAKKDAPKPAIKTEPIAALRERLDSTTSVKEVPRIPARTDRSPARPPPRLIKSTETGLTPTGQGGPPRPRGDAQPTPPIALSAIPPVPGIGVGRTDRGPIAPARTTGTPTGAAARAAAAAPAAIENTDDDEPATYIREPTGFSAPSDAAPASNNNLGRTLVMEEQAPQNARPSAVAQPHGAALTKLGSPDAKAGPSPAASPTALSPYAEPFEDEAIRALKATSRIPDDAANAQGLHPQALTAVPHARPEDPQIKATVRMNPQDTMQRVHAQHGAPLHGHPQSVVVQPGPQGLAPQPIPPASQGRIDPTLPGNASYGQLQPGQWNEPTVVRRKQEYAQHLARPQKNGLMNQLSNLSGTTGLLIGVGLGLGLAAGLLIAFLLLR
ncbi:MAG: hypothetical protein JNK04_12020 [Myxococcales bacterium]|nr:hypothetical protein [Myxococcales bacterium]